LLHGKFPGRRTTIRRLVPLLITLAATFALTGCDLINQVKLYRR
jgi:hypothetical protein